MDQDSRPVVMDASGFGTHPDRRARWTMLPRTRHRIDLICPHLDGRRDTLDIAGDLTQVKPMRMGWMTHVVQVRPGRSLTRRLVRATIGFLIGQSHRLEGDETVTSRVSRIDRR